MVYPVAAPNLRVRLPLEEDWGEWIGAAANGDQAALTKLYDRTSNLVYDLILRIVSNLDIAEEVLLDVYLQVWRNGDAYNASKGAALAWLL